MNVELMRSGQALDLSIETLNNCYDVLANAQEHGTATPRMAELTIQSVQSARSLMGLEQLQVELTGPARLQTHLAIESIWQTIKDHVKTAIEWIRKMIRAFAKWIMDFFTEIGQMDRMLEKARKEVKRLLMSRKSWPTFPPGEVGGVPEDIAGFFAFDGTGARDWADWLTRVSKTMTAMVKHSGVMLPNQTKEFGAALKHLYDGNDYTPAIPLNPISDGNRSLVPLKGSGKEQIDGMDVERLRSNVLPGGYYQEVVVCKDLSSRLRTVTGAGSSTLQHLKALAINSVSLERKEMNVAGKIYSATGMDQVSEQLERASRAMAIVRGNERAMKSMLRTALRTVDQLEPLLVTVHEMGLTSERGAQLKDGYAAFRRFVTNMTSSETTLLKYFTECMKVYMVNIRGEIEELVNIQKEIEAGTYQN